MKETSSGGKNGEPERVSALDPEELGETVATSSVDGVDIYVVIVWRTESSRCWPKSPTAFRALMIPFRVENGRMQKMRLRCVCCTATGPGPIILT